MALTQAQKTTLKQNLVANSNTILDFATNQPIAISTLNSDSPTDNLERAADWYNANATPDFYVFRQTVPAQEIFDQVTWANYTPQDAIASDGSNAALWTARSMACQGKQFNLQIMLQGQSSIDAGHIQLRAGINDATTNLPSGANGASKSGGWTGILSILKRLARRIEALYAVQTSGVGTNGANPLGDTLNPALLVFNGTINGNDIYDAFLNG